MRVALLTTLLIAAAAPARGGALTTVGRALWAPFGYVGGRVLDLADVVDLNLGLGRGAKVDVKYGVNFLGAGRVRSLRFGLNRGRLDLWQETDRSVGLFPFSLLGWPAHAAGRLLGSPRLRERALELAIAGGLGAQTVERKELAQAGAASLADVVHTWRHTTWGDSLPLGAEAHAGLVGLRAVAKPLQAVDFVLGFGGVDLDPWLAKAPF